MNCDPNYLMQQAKCYQCIPKGMQGAVMISLLCEWANHLTPPVTPFSYTPATNVMLWNDVHGGHVGDLAAFNASPDSVATVTSIQVHVLSSITGLSSLPMLTYLDIGPPGLGTPGTVADLDLTGCSGLLSLICDANNLTLLDVSPCTNLTLLTCQLNQLGNIIVKTGTPLTTFYWAANPSPIVTYI